MVLASPSFTQGSITNRNLLTIPQAAVSLNVSTALLRRYCLQGRLGVKIGGRWIIATEELRAFAAKPRPKGYPKGRPRKEVYDNVNELDE